MRQRTKMANLEKVFLIQFSLGQNEWVSKLMKIRGKLLLRLMDDSTLFESDSINNKLNIWWNEWNGERNF